MLNTKDFAVGDVLCVIMLNEDGSLANHIREVTVHQVCDDCLMAAGSSFSFRALFPSVEGEYFDMELFPGVKTKVYPDVRDAAAEIRRMRGEEPKPKKSKKGRR